MLYLSGVARSPFFPTKWSSVLLEILTGCLPASWVRKSKQVRTRQSRQGADAPMVVNERQDDWLGDPCAVPRRTRLQYSVSAATGLAHQEVHMNRLPRLTLTVIEHPYQSLDRDHRSNKPDSSKLLNFDLPSDLPGKDSSVVSLVLTRTKPTTCNDFFLPAYRRMFSTITLRSLLRTMLRKMMPPWAFGSGTSFQAWIGSGSRWGHRCPSRDPLQRSLPSFLGMGGRPPALPTAYVSFILVGKGMPDQQQSTNRRLRAMRVGSAMRELARLTKATDTFHRVTPSSLVRLGDAVRRTLRSLLEPSSSKRLNTACGASVKSPGVSTSILPHSFPRWPWTCQDRPSWRPLHHIHPPALFKARGASKFEVVALCWKAPFGMWIYRGMSPTPSLSHLAFCVCSLPFLFVRSWWVF